MDNPTIQSSIRHFSKSAVSYGKRSVEKGTFALDVPIDDENFVYVPFRHISSGIIGQGTRKSTEFPADVLKASLALFKNLHVYTNHEQYVGMEIGCVLDASWSEGYTLPNGQRVPSGIEAVVQIDNVSYNALARKLTLWAVKLHSVSVGISFSYKKSHEDMSDEEFMRNRGQMVGDNEVRLIATEVTKYWETSIVYEGADKHAKRIGRDGKIEVYNEEQAQEEGIETFEVELPTYTQESINLFNNIEAMTDKTQKELPIPVTTEKVEGKEVVTNEPTLEASKEVEVEPLFTFNKVEPSFTFNFDESKDRELFEAALDKRGLSVLDTEDYKATVTELETVKAELLQRNTEITTFQASLGMVTEQLTSQKNLTSETQIQLSAQQTERENLQLQVETLEAERESEKVIYNVGLESINDLKAIAKKEYEVYAKENINADIVAKIEAETSTKELETLIEMYSGKSMEKYGSRCSDCGSDKVEFRSSIASPDSNQQTINVARDNEPSFENFGNRFRKYN